MSKTLLCKNGCFVLKQPFFFYLLFILLISLANCTKEVTDQDKILFSVNDIEVTTYDFEVAYVNYLIRTGRNDSRNERYAFLNQMIDELAMAIQAADIGLTDNGVYKAALNFQRMKSTVDVYFVDEMDNLLEPPTDEQMRLAYAKSKRSVYVRHLYSKNEQDLQEPYRRLKSGEDFVDVANDFYKTEKYDSSAGYLGPISYFGVDDAFAEAAYSTNQGDFTKPVRTMFGYHIIYVEFIEFPAMLAEDDYQYRKKGISSQVRLRNQELVSNEYIRDLMGSLLVEVERDQVLQLMEAIKGLNQPEIQNEGDLSNELQNDGWRSSNLDELSAAFDNEAVLGTYVLGGERQDFTFEDYLRWLPYLSFEESKTRTGASIGRALRNEVLYKIGKEKGYETDPRVEKKVRQKGYEKLSELYQYELTKEAIEDTSDVIVPSSFRDRLVRNRDFQMVASYWKIPASSMDEAIEIKKDIEANGVPEKYDSFTEFKEENVLTTDSDYSLVRDGLIEMPVVAHSADGWIVLLVEERKITEINKNTDQSELKLRFKVFDHINTEITGIREELTIEVDTTLFNEIYEIYKKKSE